jgi:hypothetical protein
MSTSQLFRHDRPCCRTCRIRTLLLKRWGLLNMSGIEERLSQRLPSTDSAVAIGDGCSRLRLERYRPQTVSCFLPFCLRRLSTLRPPLVCMRARKPCTRYRRFFFGCQVRFGTCLS